jgi:hypothetical protein
LPATQRAAQQDVAALHSEHCPYVSSLDHLFDELAGIDLLIQARLAELRQVQRNEDEFRGLYVSEADVDALIARPIGCSLGRSSTADPASATDGAIAGRRHEIARRKAASLERGVCLRLDRLARLFDLTAFDADVLLIGLAPALDLRYERLYAYLQDDVTRKRPSVDLALGLLCSSLEERVAARERFAATSPLLRHELITVVEDPAQPSTSLLGHHLKADERIVGYLLGSDALDARTARHCRTLEPEGNLDEVGLAVTEWQRLVDITAPEQRSGRGLVLCLRGPEGVGRRATAQAVCRHWGIKLLAVDCRRLQDTDAGEFERAARLVLREALLQDAALLFADFDGLLTDDKARHLNALTALL